MWSLMKVLKALTHRSWHADSLIETVKRGMAMRACGNFCLASRTSRRVSLIIVSAVCSLRQLLMPIEKIINVMSGLGDVSLRRMAVRCLSVAPGKLSAWMPSNRNLGMRAILESPIMITGCLMGRDHMVAFRLV